MPPLYEIFNDTLWPLKLAGAIVLAYLIHEWVQTDFGGPDDPDGWV